MLKMYTIFFLHMQAQAYESNTTFKCQFTKENSSNNSRLHSNNLIGTIRFKNWTKIANNQKNSKP